MDITVHVSPPALSSQLPACSAQCQVLLTVAIHLVT